MAKINLYSSYNLVEPIDNLDGLAEFRQCPIVVKAEDLTQLHILMEDVKLVKRPKDFTLEELRVVLEKGVPKAKYMINIIMALHIPVVCLCNLVRRERNPDEDYPLTWRYLIPINPDGVDLAFYYSGVSSMRLIRSVSSKMEILDTFQRRKDVSGNAIHILAPTNHIDPRSKRQCQTTQSIVTISEISSNFEALGQPILRAYTYRTVLTRSKGIRWYFDNFISGM